MPVDLPCPKCDSTFEAKNSLIGSWVTCPYCEASFRAIDPNAEPEERSGRFRSRSSSRSRNDRDVEDNESDYRPEARRRRRSGRSRRRTGDSTAVLWAILVPVILGIGVGMFFLIRWAVKDDGSSWERVEESGKFRVKMPGKPSKETKFAEWTNITQYTYSPKGSDSGFTAGCSETQIPFQRAMIPPETLLGEACSEFVRGSQGSEVSRQFVQSSGYCYMEIIVDSPKRTARAICRYYLARGWLLFAAAAGKGYSTSHDDVKRFFDSFEILVDLPKDSQPPIEQPQVQQPPIQQPPVQQPPIQRPPVRPKVEPIRPQPPVQPKANPKYEEPDNRVLAARPADARLSVPDSSVYLSDMTEFGLRPCAPQTHFGKNGRIGKDSNPNEMMEVGGRKPEKGLGTHAPLGDYTRVCYSLGQKAKTFEGAVAISGTGQAFTPCHFLILGDGQVLWRSNATQKKGVEQAFSIDVSNVNILELRAYIERGNIANCWGVWVDPLVRVK